MLSKKVTRLKFLTIYLGNVFEHYDTALYGFLAPFFAGIFFPKHDYLLALILMYGMIPLGKLARPLGGLFFGYIGDTRGRTAALMISLFGMSIVTFAVGLIPTYTHVGIYAPILFLCLRLGQSFFASGESTGGAIYLLEQVSDESEKDLLASIYSTSTIVGILLASTLVTLFYYLGIVEESWRVLYFLGALTAIFGAINRLKYKEEERGIRAASPVDFMKELKNVSSRPKVILAVIFSSGFGYASYSMAFILINGFVPMISDLKKGDLMEINTLLLMLDFCLLPLFGKLASYYSRNIVMGSALVITVLTAIPMFQLLSCPSLFNVIILRVYIVVIGVSFSATFHSWAQSLISPSCRYTVIAVLYSVGSLCFGSSAAVIGLSIYKMTGLVSSIGWYWMALAIVTFFFFIQAQPDGRKSKIIV